MIFTRNKKFRKAYRKLSSKKKAQVDRAVVIFVKNPKAEKLRNHVLRGKYKGLNSMSAAGDLRIIFKIRGDYVEVIFLNVGSHNQVY